MVPLRMLLLLWTTRCSRLLPLLLVLPLLLRPRRTAAPSDRTASLVLALALALVMPSPPPPAPAIASPLRPYPRRPPSSPRSRWPSRTGVGSERSAHSPWPSVTVVGTTRPRPCPLPCPWPCSIGLWSCSNRNCLDPERRPCPGHYRRHCRRHCRHRHRYRHHHHRHRHRYHYH